MKRAEIARLLPGIFQRTLRDGNPLFAILEVMEAQHAPDEEVLEHLGTFFDPYQAPDRFVSFLAGWVDMERILVESPEERALTGVAPLPSGLGQLRELIAAAAFLAKWRGTASGLLRFLETATGVHGFVIDEHVPGPNGLPKPFHFEIRAPKETESYRHTLERVIDLEKPAYVTYDLKFGS